MQVRYLLLSAIEKCLSSVLDKHNEWIDFLIKSLLERLRLSNFFVCGKIMNIGVSFGLHRASSDGPVWLVVIQQVFSTLSKVMTDDNRAALTERLVR